MDRYVNDLDVKAIAHNPAHSDELLLISDRHRVQRPWKCRRGRIGILWGKARGDPEGAVLLDGGSFRHDGEIHAASIRIGSCVFAGVPPPQTATCAAWNIDLGRLGKVVTSVSFCQA